MAKESVLGMLKRPVQPKSVEMPTAADPNASLYWIIKESKEDARRVAEGLVEEAEKRAEEVERAAKERLDAAIAELDAERLRGAELNKAHQAIVDRVNAIEQNLTSALQGISDALSASLTTPRTDIGQMAEIMKKIVGIESALAKTPKPAAFKMPEFPELTVDIVSRDLNRDIRQLNIKPRN